MLYKVYQRITFNNKKYMNTYGYLGCFNCAFENDEESCKEINKFKKCGQKDNKRNDDFEFVFKELKPEVPKLNQQRRKKIKQQKESEPTSNSTTTRNY